MPSERDAEVMRAYPDLFGPEPWGWIIADGFLVGEGWRAIVLDLLEELRAVIRDEDPDRFRVQHVKQKFGTLRVYTSLANERADAAIARAQDRAARTCEACGRLGQLRTDYPFVQTLCDAHAEARGRRDLWLPEADDE